MLTVIDKEDFKLYKIDKEFHGDFIPKDSHELSNAESWMLKVVGDAIRKRSSEHFWNNGCYSWFIYISKEVRSIEQRVFLTHNGILVFEDCTKKEMYRVHPM